MTSTDAAPRRLDAHALRELIDSDSAPRVLDVRTPAEFETAHIPGSYNVPLDNLKEHRTELRRHLDEDVVLVCRSGARATQAEKALAEVGLPGLHVLEGGMVAWEGSGAPVNRGRQTWELERQVRLVAGSLVAASVFGSAAAPRLKWLAAGVGSGLVFAAVSNTCAMGTLLSKMPWNKQAVSCDMDQVVKALAEAS
jgi:rhodanese-related sulfurtransferase